MRPSLPSRSVTSGRWSLSCGWVRAMNWTQAYDMRAFRRALSFKGTEYFPTSTVGFPPRLKTLTLRALMVMAIPGELVSSTSPFGDWSPSRGMELEEANTIQEGEKNVDSFMRGLILEAARSSDESGGFWR